MSKIINEAILWAVDPFEKETRPDQSVVQQLMNWAKTSNLDIQPVYILSLPLGESQDFLDGSGPSTFYTSAEKASEAYLRELGVEEKTTRPVKVILSDSPSRKECVTALLDYADQVRPPCIVVSSHGRSGVQRLFLGSFAENLVLRSKYPAFFLTHWKAAAPAHPAPRAVFATDFSEYSHQAFLSFLAEAKRFQFDLTLLHSVTLPPGALISGYGAQFVIADDFFTNQVDWAKEEGEKWVRLSESQGVHARLVVKDEGVVSSVAETILSIADRVHAELIVMASISGPLTTTVMGSVAHDVFRSNRYPVWIYGPKTFGKILVQPKQMSAFA
jgi:nucleotide-binding universal stress UspA family protein